MDSTYEFGGTHFSSKHILHKNELQMDEELKCENQNFIWLKM